MHKTVRGDQPLAKDVKPPELVAAPDGQLGVKVYLCRDCAATIREKEQQGHALKSIDVRWLCATCRANALRGR